MLPDLALLRSGGIAERRGLVEPWRTRRFELVEATTTDVSEERVVPGPFLMRMGWSQTRVFDAQGFMGEPGSASGQTDAGVQTPPFPVALASEPSLYLGIWIATAAEPVRFEIREGLTINQNQFFPVADRQPLYVDGEDGRYYPATIPFFAPGQAVELYYVVFA